MSVMKVCRKVLFRLTMFGLVTTGLFYFIAGTQAGLNLIVSSVTHLLPDKVHIGSIQGTLLSRLVIRDLDYQDESVTVTIRALDVDANFLSLIGHRYIIRDIQVNGLRVNVKLSTTSTEDSSGMNVDDIPALLNRIHIDAATIHDARVQVADAKFMLEGKFDDRWQLQWSANIPDLNHLQKALHGKVVTTGKIAGARDLPEIEAALRLDKFSSGFVVISSLQGKFNSKLDIIWTNAGRLQVKGLSINDILIPDFVLQLNGQLQAPTLKQQAVIELSPQNHIYADIVFPKLNKKDGIDQKFKANAKAEVYDFSQFKTLFIDAPEVQQIKGQVTGAFTGVGSLLHPVFDGGLTAQNGSVYIPAAKTHLTDIHLTTRYHSGQKVVLGGTFMLGKGVLSLSGTYGIEESALPLVINIKGTDILVKDTKEYLVKITPDVNVDYRNNDVIVSGKIAVPEAVIQPLDFSNTATLPGDVVIVNQQSPTASSSVPTNLTLRMQVTLGDRVKIKYRGLKAKLQGSVTIIGEEGNPLTATGEFGIAKNGTYHAYGRSLTIDQGRIIYAGNLLTNPGISLRASQQIKKVGFSGGGQFDEPDFKPVYVGADTLTVGIEVSGTVDKPRITLFSDPSGLSQGDILSYLLLGYPQAQAKGSASLALLNVVSDMYGPSENKNVVNNLQKSLGLDELSVGTTEYYDVNNTDTNVTHSTTTVNLGRNLGRNLSVHYSVGIFQQIQVFSLRYQINKHLAIQTETSTLENGGDLLYQLESRD